MTELYTLPLPLILLGWAVSAGSPGPATLAISGTSMAYGRSSGLSLAIGVTAGSACWGIAAALGFSAIMMSSQWIFETVRYAGALYLLYLAAKSLRSAFQGGGIAPVKTGGAGGFFRRGLFLHLTNPKAVLGWGSIYAIALAPESGASAVWILFGSLLMCSMTMFCGYAILFSTAMISRGYARTKRWFEFVFGVLFGAASIKLLTYRPE